ncbi:MULTISPECIES: DNA replication initiation control protein YabA [unclassified Streptococcus]|uniref:DNA replication initiation control protein YabA n=1 Tax=unclassified Streptococcus TaxID=2608887 RepID=UPI0011B54B47|nr:MULTISPECIES: DNA replication initiation control protein YabA [unclassified Streptococcus]TWS94088.1 DNA replication initiation control protein YabA [Streptococcus sp. sy018]TWT09908.1 DNA replication initiation control protein YabA [Streptococcus sp. sy004]TWT14215.1 DNA replication initiation control protein YabA [Streptococcus sp. sy010]
MVKKDLFDAFDGFSQNLMLTLADVEAMKKQVQALVEENARLRLENTKLRQYFEEVEKGKTRTSKETRDTLLGIYQDGFHVCKDFYGQRRDNDGDCLWCDEQLERA